ncbi:putative ribonuclease H-like domain-containing protein [Tanacetum coccineum]
MAMLTMRAGRLLNNAWAPRENWNREPVRRNVIAETKETKALVAQDVLRYDWSDQAEEGPINFALMTYTSSGLESVEARLDVYKKNEVVYEEDIKILKVDIMLRDNALTERRKKFEKAEKEGDDLKLTLEKFKNSSKNLSKLLEIQVSDKFKTGVGYHSQVFNSQVNDKYKTSEGYHVIPPPYTRNFMPPKSNLVLADEDEYVFSESVTSVPDVATSEAESIESKAKTVKKVEKTPSFAKVEFVKSNEHVKTPKESVKKVKNNKQAKYPRKNSQSPRDCDFYEKKMMEKLVWNNASRVNHQNSQRSTHPYPIGNFIPKAVLMKSGHKTLNNARQNSLKATISVNTAKPINTAYPRPTVNCARPSSNVFNKAHSHVRRPFNKFTTDTNNNFKAKVNTFKGNVTTVGPKAIVSNNKGHEANVGKSSACWVWRPKQKVLDHVSRHNGASMNLKRFDYGNPLLDLQEKGFIDSGCSRHMTGNNSYLSNYEEIDGGFVAFGGSTKGGKITGKGKIRTGKLDFEDVYFVKELKFNLFSVSQMCDNKNNVLFIDTECVVLSLDFKLLDENQVLLRVPKKNNMYSVDLKNVFPSGGLTCLFAKATLDESNLWHGRLRHINFKTMNKLVRGNLVRGLHNKMSSWDERNKQYTNEAARTYAMLIQVNLLPFRIERSTKESIDACQVGKKTVPSHEYILLSLWTPDSPISSSHKSLDDGVAHDAGKKSTEDPAKEEAKININSTNSVSVVSSLDNTAGTQDADVNSTNSSYTASPLINFDGLSHFNANLPDGPRMPNLEDIGIFGGAYDDEGVGAEADMNNLDTFMTVSPIPTTKIHKDHPFEQIIGYLHSTPQTRRMTKSMTGHVEPKKVIQALKDLSWIEAMQDKLLQFKLQQVWTLVDLPYGKRAISTKWVYRNKKAERGIVIKNKARLFLDYASFKDFVVYQMDVKSAFQYGKIEEEVYVCQPLGFEDSEFPDRVYMVEKALYGLHQAPRAWYETLSTYLLDNGFQRGIINKSLFIKKVKGDILLVQVYVDDIIFGSTKKSLCTEFEKLMHKKF